MAKTGRHLIGLFLLAAATENGVASQTVMRHKDCAIIALRWRVRISGNPQSGTVLDLDCVSAISAALPPITTDELRVIYMNFHVGGRLSWPNQYDIKLFVP